MRKLMPFEAGITTKCFKADMACWFLGPSIFSLFLICITTTIAMKPIPFYVSLSAGVTWKTMASVPFNCWCDAFWCLVWPARYGV